MSKALLDRLLAEAGCHRTITEGSESPWVIYDHQLEEIVNRYAAAMLEGAANAVNTELRDIQHKPGFVAPDYRLRSCLCGSFDVGGGNGTVSCYKCKKTIKRDNLTEAIQAWNTESIPSDEPLDLEREKAKARFNALVEMRDFVKRIADNSAGSKQEGTLDVAQAIDALITNEFAVDHQKAADVQGYETKEARTMKL